MIDEEMVLREFRRRMVAATGIDPETQLKVENFDFSLAVPTVCEFSFGGEEELVSSSRSRIRDFLIEYDVFAARGSGGEKARAIAAAIRREFDMSDDARRAVSGPGFDGIVKSVFSLTGHDDHVFRIQVPIHADIWEVRLG